VTFVISRLLPNVGLIKTDKMNRVNAGMYFSLDIISKILFLQKTPFLKGEMSLFRVNLEMEKGQTGF
jgi:hypothetical protein